MATPLHRPRAAEPDLNRALAAVEAAYDRLMAAPRQDQRLLVELQHRARELAEAAASPSEEASQGRSRKVRRRCLGADRGAGWIITHCR